VCFRHFVNGEPGTHKVYGTLFDNPNVNPNPNPNPRSGIHAIP